MRIIATIAASLVLVACAPDFDRAAWAAAKGADPADNPRSAMVDDAERAGLKPGATRAFVRDLLGEPDSDPSIAVTEVYELGVAAWSPDEDFLIVEYDAQGIVTRVRIRTEG